MGNIYIEIIDVNFGVPNTLYFFFHENVMKTREENLRKEKLADLVIIFLGYLCEDETRERSHAGEPRNGYRETRTENRERRTEKRATRNEKRETRNEHRERRKEKGERRKEKRETRTENREPRTENREPRNEKQRETRNEKREKLETRNEKGEIETTNEKGKKEKGETKTRNASDRRAILSPKSSLKCCLEELTNCLTVLVKIIFESCLEELSLSTVF